MFADGVGAWLCQHLSLINALVVQRLDHQSEAVDALLGLSVVRQLRLSWELEEQLLSDPGSIEAALANTLPSGVVAACRYALWDIPLPEELRGLRAVAAPDEGLSRPARGTYRFAPSE
jgi:hypothetical protein